MCVWCALHLSDLRYLGVSIDMAESRLLQPQRLVVLRSFFLHWWVSCEHLGFDFGVDFGLSGEVAGVDVAGLGPHCSGLGREWSVCVVLS